MNQTIRKVMVIDHARVSGYGLYDFPVLVEFVDSNFVSGNFQAPGHDEHYTHPQGTNIRFTAGDGTTLLDHEIETFVPEHGLLRAWVKIPFLSGSVDTVLQVCYGQMEAEPQEARLSVWDSSYRLVLHRPQNGLVVDHSDQMEITDAITVEAWVNDRTARAEAMQVLVSKWSPLSTFDTFDAYDAGQTDGLDTTGFFGAVFDGRYVYFVPQHDAQSRHGKVLRYDTHADFGSSSNWQSYDAGHTDDLNTKGYYGAVFDGRYVYFVPRRDTDDFHSRVLRYDTQGEFIDSANWAAYDAGLSRSYQSAAFDGRYIYFCPGHVAIPKDSVASAPDSASPAVTGMSSDFYLAGNSIVLRHDTHGEFKEPASWATYDAGGTQGLDTCDYDGAVFDGRYVYFVPLSTGVVLRYDTNGDFNDKTSWTAFDAKPSGIKLCVGAVFDGHYVYFVPYGESEIAVRYDSEKLFDDRNSWSTYRITDTTGLPAPGFDGGCFDGRYVYFIPYYDGGSHFHGYVLRYDTQGDFANPQSWLVTDAGEVNGLRTVGFNGGASDGRYLYFAPWQDGSTFPQSITGNGRVLRYDTLGGNGSFSLRYVDYGHNGGLCAAVPGARFLINTEHGAVSVSANRNPTAGRHHLAGIYDGKSIQLYIDGELINAQTATGRIATNDVDLSIGRLLEGLGDFGGHIEEVRISAVARSSDWIQTQYNNMIDPSGFCHVKE